MKPVVDRLEQEFKGKVEFRVYVDDSGPDNLAGTLGVQYVPTYVFVNTDGSIAQQVVGGMAEEDMRKALEALN
ncbi:MAG: hypothetical protein C0418_00210 [Coriobacteriaceae bacterium]|nr:hypothetical protein [Coriobacteriaceae bacterium]